MPSPGEDQVIARWWLWQVSTFRTIFPQVSGNGHMGLGPLKAWGNPDDSWESSPACLASLGTVFLTAGLELLKSPLITQSFISSVKFKERFWFYCYHFAYNFISSLSISCYERAKVMELDVLCLKVSMILLTEIPLAWEFQSQKKTTGFWLACIYSSARGHRGSSGRGQSGRIPALHSPEVGRSVGVRTEPLSQLAQGWLGVCSLGWNNYFIGSGSKDKKIVTILHNLSQTENFTWLWKCVKC